MESRVEKMERSLLELKKENQIRLEEIKQLWKRRKGDYHKRRSRRDHAPARHRRTPTWYAEEKKNEEIRVDQKLQHSELGNPTLLLGAMDSNLPKSEAKEEENDKREHRDADAVAQVVDEGKEPLPDEVFNPLNAVSFSGSWICFNFFLLSPDPVRSSYREFETFASSTSTPSPGKTTVSTITAAPEMDRHHRAAALFLSDQPSATVQADRRHHDATVHPRSDLEPSLLLGAKTREAIVGNLHAPPPKPPQPEPLDVSTQTTVMVCNSSLISVATVVRKLLEELRAEKETRSTGQIFDLMGQAQLSLVHCDYDARSCGMPYYGPGQNTNYWAQFAHAWKNFQEERKTGLMICGPLLISQIELETEGGHSLSFGQRVEEHNMREGTGLAAEKMVAIWLEARRNAAGINAAIKLCFIIKNITEDRAFDPGGNHCVSCIIWSLCSKQWDPGRNYYESSISWSVCFKQWDPGERFFLLSGLYTFTLRTR